MKSRTWTLGSIFSLMVVLLVAPSVVYAAPIRVDCGKGGSISGTLASLASAGNARSITIFVTGTCRENVFVYPFDHLTLQAAPIATLQDASNGTAPVIEIFNSFDVSVTGFTITGGSSGINCDIGSVCTLLQNRVQQAADGVRFVSSHGLVVSNNISNNTSRGLAVLTGASVHTSANTVSGNIDYGVMVGFGSDVTAGLDTIQNNGVGIHVVQGSVFRGGSLTITGNNSDGVLLESSSTASLLNGSNVITGNGGSGVSVNDLSFAEFSSTDNIGGNLTQPDVACNPQYSATRGAGVGGTTNCVEPQRKR